MSYAYTRDSEGHYVGTIRGERVTAHNRDDFLKLAHQAESRYWQRRRIMAKTDRRSTFSRVNRLLGVRG